MNAPFRENLSRKLIPGEVNVHSDVELLSLTHEGKVKRLREVGATVVDEFGEIPEAAEKLINSLNLN